MCLNILEHLLHQVNLVTHVVYRINDNILKAEFIAEKSVQDYRQQFKADGGKHRPCRRYNHIKHNNSHEKGSHASTDEFHSERDSFLRFWFCPKGRAVVAPSPTLENHFGRQFDTMSLTIS